MYSNIFQLKKYIYIYIFFMSVESERPSEREFVLLRNDFLQPPNRILACFYFSLVSGFYVCRANSNIMLPWCWYGGWVGGKGNDDSTGIRGRMYPPPHADVSFSSVLIPRGQKRGAIGWRWQADGAFAGKQQSAYECLSGMLRKGSAGNIGQAAVGT